MLDAPTLSAPVGAWARGQGRLFRSAVKLVDLQFDAALDTITAPLRARLKRHPKLRPEGPDVVASQYSRLIPSQYRIGKITGTRHRTEFAIVETRACVSWLTCDDWSDPEEREVGVSICRFTFSVHEGRLRRRWTPLTNVSLHVRWGDSTNATGGPPRRRCGPTSSCSPLPTMRATGRRRRRGSWLGRTIDAEGEGGRVLRIRNIRTWLAS